MAIIKKIVQASELRHGDTVEVENKLETVSRANIKPDAFFGGTYKGAAYPRGITKIIFKVPIAGGGFRYE